MAATGPTEPDLAQAKTPLLRFVVNLLEQVIQ